MGLILNKITNTGVPVEYWNIGAVQIDSFLKIIEVTLYGYVDVQTRLDSYQNCTKEALTFYGADYEALLNILTNDDINMFSSLYNFIKDKHPVYSLAEDEFTSCRQEIVSALT